MMASVGIRCHLLLLVNLLSLNILIAVIAKEVHVLNRHSVIQIQPHSLPA